MPSGAAAGVPPEERALRDAWKRHVAGARRTAAAVDAYVREASASLEAASPQEALRLFQAQWQTLPDERKWPEALRTGEDRREHAALTGHRGEAKTAVTIIDDGRRFADNQAEAWNQLGLALIVLGQLENVPNALQESVAAYRSALTAKPDRLNEPRIRINLAAALLELGAQTGAKQASLRAERLGEAKDILQSVLAAPRLPLPDRARAEDNLGNVLMELGGADNTAQAFAAYERALQAGASRSHRDRILNNRGTPFWRLATLRRLTGISRLLFGTATGRGRKHASAMERAETQPGGSASGVVPSADRAREKTVGDGGDKGL